MGVSGFEVTRRPMLRQFYKFSLRVHEHCLFTSFFTTQEHQLAYRSRWRTRRSHSVRPAASSRQASAECEVIYCKYERSRIEFDMLPKDCAPEVRRHPPTTARITFSKRPGMALLFISTLVQARAEWVPQAPHNGPAVSHLHASSHRVATAPQPLDAHSRYQATPCRFRVESLAGRVANRTPPPVFGRISKEIRKPREG